jgi:hypothetical protein
MKKFLIIMVSDDNGIISSKRVLGTLCVLALVICLLMSAFSKRTIVPSGDLVYSIAGFALASFGLSTMEKVMGKKNEKNEVRFNKNSTEEIG